jgi:hypothetical protein
MRLKTAEEIRDFQATVLEALLERRSVNIHITQISDPSGQASTGMTLGTAQDQERFLADCEEALQALEGDAPASPAGIDFSWRRTEF